MNNKQITTGVFIGRFQPFHDGHKKCINYILEKHDQCLVLLRDTKQSDKNPFTIVERNNMIAKAFPSRVRLGIIPDEGCDLTMYIGRDVGYDLIKLDAETENISATDIRKELYGTKET